MFIVSRKDFESLLIYPGDGVDPQLTLAKLFEHGPIEIKIFTARENQVTIGVDAPLHLSIWRRGINGG